MLMIIAHHYVVNSGITELYNFSQVSGNQLFLELLGWGGKAGINCFLLVTGYWTLHVLNNGFGKYLRRDLGYTFGEQSYVFILICTYLIWAALVALVAFVTLVIVNTNYDKKKVNALIAAGAATYALLALLLMRREAKAFRLPKSRRKAVEYDKI